jgi:DNA-binding MarR family transcriptional regulator
MKPLRFALDVHRATHRIALYLEAAEPPLDVSQGEAHLLAYLVEVGDTSLGELHAAFAHKRSTLTSYVDRLEAKRLVRRELRPEDRRSFQVSLTAAGRALATRVHRRLAALEAAALERMPARDVEALTKGLQALAGAGEEAGPARRPRAKEAALAQAGAEVGPARGARAKEAALAQAGEEAGPARRSRAKEAALAQAGAEARPARRSQAKEATLTRAGDAVPPARKTRGKGGGR